MLRVQVVTPWVGSGTAADPMRPKLADEHTIRSWRDVTGQPSENLTPDPNAFTIEIICDEATLNAIVAAGYVTLWSEPA